MKILVATPAGGGMVTTQYMASFLSTVEGVAKVNNEHFQGRPGIQIGIYTLTHESLISRGRNHCAQVALAGGWDKCFFIDADAGWSFDQFMAVATAKGDIVAGTCPLKTYPISMNYLPYKDDEHYYKNALRSVESLRAMRQGHGTPLIRVPFVGTAFMCIGTHVFRKLSEIAEPYQFPNPTTGQMETHWDFFQTKPVKKMYMSEDWGFCNLARENGYDVYIHADVIITHTGNHTFRAPPPPPPEAAPPAQTVSKAVPVEAVEMALESKGQAGVIVKDGGTAAQGEVQVVDTENTTQLTFPTMEDSPDVEATKTP
jgi:hypothetical protein